MGLFKLKLPWRAVDSGQPPNFDKFNTVQGESFYIQLQDPHREYSPGSLVAGSLVLEIRKPQPIASIAVHFEASVQVRTHSVNPKTTSRLLFKDTLDIWTSRPGSKASDTTLHTTNSPASSGNATPSDRTAPPLQESDCSSNESLSDALLGPGEHRFDFEVQLPNTGLVGSLDFERGAISYLITGLLKRPGKRVKVTPERPISVVCPLDVSSLPPAKVVSLVVNTGKRTKQDKVVVKLDLPHKGYLKGEQIPVGLRVRHAWNVQSPASIVVTLARITRLNSEDDTTQTFRKDLAQSILPMYTDPDTFVATSNTTLKIPPEVFPTLKHPLATFQYLIEVAIDLSGKLDVHKWANANPAVQFIDTDRFKHRSAVVSAWSEVVIGTHRSVPILEINGRATRSSSMSTAHNPSSINSIHQTAHIGSANSDSSRSTPISGFVHSFSSQPQGTVSSGGTPPVSVSEEKAQLAAREAALYPSEPIYEVEDEGQPLSAPVLSNGHHRSRPADPSVAEHHMLDDKRELEQRRLAALATRPEDDVAPVYERNPSPSRSYQEYPDAPPSTGPALVPSAPPLDNDDNRLAHVVAPPLP